MKTKLFTLSVFLMGLIVASCSRDKSLDKNELTISISIANLDSYVLPSKTATDKERLFDDLALYMIDETGLISHLKNVEFNSTDNGKSVTISSLTKSQKYQFYVTANIPVESVDITSKTAMLNSIHRGMSQVAAAGGNLVPMSDYLEVTTDNSSNPVDATMSLKRRVARVDLNNLTASTITKVFFSEANTKGYVFAPSEDDVIVDDEVKDIDLEVAAGDQKRAPFMYLYPSVNTQIQLLVNHNGKNVIVDVPNEGIEANKRYIITLGASGESCRATVQVVDDWESEFDITVDPYAVISTVSPASATGGQFENGILTIEKTLSGVITLNTTSNMPGIFTLEAEGLGKDYVDYTFTEELVLHSAEYKGVMEIKTKTNLYLEGLDCKFMLIKFKGSDKEERFEFGIKREEAETRFGGNKAFPGIIAVDRYGNLNIDGEGFIVHFKYGSLIAMAFPSYLVYDIWNLPEQNKGVKNSECILICPEGYEGVKEISDEQDDFDLKIPFTDINYGNVIPEVNDVKKGIGDPCRMFNTDEVKYMMPGVDKNFGYNGFLASEFGNFVKNYEGTGAIGRFCSADNQFYPTTGSRYKDGAKSIHTYGYYWSGVPVGDDIGAYHLLFDEYKTVVNQHNGANWAFAVRCIQVK